MKRLILLSLFLAGCNPACDQNAMRTCGTVCGAPGVDSFGWDGCKCKPGTPTVTTTTTTAVVPPAAPEKTP